MTSCHMTLDPMAKDTASEQTRGDETQQETARCEANRLVSGKGREAWVDPSVAVQSNGPSVGREYELVQRFPHTAHTTNTVGVGCSV